MSDEYENGMDSDSETATRKTSALDDEACFIKLKKWFAEAQQSTSDWRADAKEDYSFAAGDQWTENERSVLRDQMRPVIVFNRIAPVLDSVSGTEVSNRQEVKYYPRTDGDVQANEVLTSAAKWFRDQCDAEDEESDAFMDVLICGMGWTETRLDYELDEEGAPVIDRIDPFEMYWDAGAKKRNIDDARHVFRVREIPTDDAIALIPDVDENELDAAWARAQKGGPGNGESREESRFYRPTGNADEHSSARDTVTLVECQWWERESVHLFADPATGEVAELDDESFTIYAKRAGELGLGKPQSVTMTRRKYYRAYLGRSLLLKEESPFQGHFSFKAITGKRDSTKGTFYGLVRQMKDPQRWANKWLSQTLHIMNVNAKGGVMVEDGVAEDMREFEKNWSRPDAVTRVKEGVLAGPSPRIQPKPGAQLPSGFFNLLEFAITSVRDASGVNMELLGMADRQQAGVLEAQRKRSAMAILATLFDSLRRYRKSQGRLLMQIIMEHLSDGRLVRIVGEEGEKYVPLVKQEGVSKYDVKVDDAPNSPHQREMTWTMLQQILPMVRDQMTPEMWAVLLETSPLPTSVIEKFKQMITQGQQGAQEMQAEQAQIAKAGAIADVNETQSKANLNNAKAQAEGASSAPASAAAPSPEDQASAALAAMEIEAKGKKLQLEILQADLKASRLIQSGGLDSETVDLESRRLANEKLNLEIQARLKDLSSSTSRADAEAINLDAAKSNYEAAQNLVSAVGGSVAAMTDVVEKISKTQQEMAAAMSAPKMIIRDENGRAVGVKSVSAVNEKAEK